jgi:cytochrome c oxidase cbb3-type subunit IV
MSYDSATTLSQIFALVLFMGLFIGVIVYVFWPGNRKKFDEAAQLPLDDENNDKPEGDRS